MKLLGGNQIKAAEVEGRPANGLDGGNSQAGLLTGGDSSRQAPVADFEAHIKTSLLEKKETGMQEGFSAPWMSKAGTAEIVRLWADEISASAPAREHLDFQLHMMQHLDLLIERLGGRRGIPPT